MTAGGEFALPQTSARSRWDRAVARYVAAERLAAAADAVTDARRSDNAVERLGEEATKMQDVLIERTEAPDLAAIRLKLDLATARAEPFEDVLFDDHARAIVADIYRLADQPSAAIDPHPQWLADRNRIHIIANRWSPMADGLMDDLTGMLSDMERRIGDTPAASAEGWAAKAALLLQLPSEGADACEEEANVVLREGATIFGLSSNGCARPVPCPPTRAWDAALAALDAADAAMAALAGRYTDDALDRCGAACTRAIEAWLALPAPDLASALARMKRLSEDRPKVGSRFERTDIDWPALIAEAARMGAEA